MPTWSGPTTGHPGYCRCRSKRFGPLPLHPGRYSQLFSQHSTPAASRSSFRRIRGKKVRSVITKQLSKWGTRQGYGVPQGAPLSPLMTNWYLTSVDKFFERRKSLLISATWMISFYWSPATTGALNHVWSTWRRSSISLSSNSTIQSQDSQRYNRR